MEKLKFVYQAICVKQSAESKPLVLFGAPVNEIEQWAGIPQKKSFEPDGSESSGFQRTENRKRLEQLKSFYNNQSNVVQNSLICGLKKIEGGSVNFETSDDISGRIIIEFPNLYTAPLETLFSLLRSTLEARIGVLKEEIDPNAISTLKARVLDGDIQEELPIDEGSTDDNEMSAEGVIFEETHLDEFLRDVVIRHEILKELIDDEAIQHANQFLGFERSALLSFLLPITLVDGQHRLKGAVLAAKSRLDDEEVMQEVALRIDGGENYQTVEKDLMNRFSRTLPVSLLMEDDPKEQVFQFVVINQKATPIGKSLLGTIISTSLTNDEMESVSGRLKDSGIILEEARSITWAARNPESPFYGLVERGIQSEKKDLLQWSVMGSLIQIFKELKGGSLFHSKVDYAKRWKDKYLVESSLIESNDLEESFEEWRKLDGQWRGVFIAFWKKIQEEFSDKENSDKPNYWGRSRHSNIFNKISLTILASDFFKYLVSTKSTINEVSDVEQLVNDWLEDINRGYFDRDWQLSGVKKDSTGIRAKWSELWSDYRDSPEQFPQIRAYRTPRK